MTVSIPDKLLINLKIISRIEKNGRIARSTSGLISLENNTFYQSFKRFINHDSRKQSLSEINCIIKESENKIDDLLDNNSLRGLIGRDYIRICEILTLFLNELPGVISGLENLKFTYKTDIHTESQIDIILINVKSIFTNLSVKLPFLVSKIPLDSRTNTLGNDTMSIKQD